MRKRTMVLTKAWFEKRERLVVKFIQDNFENDMGCQVGDSTAECIAERYLIAVGYDNITEKKVRDFVAWQDTNELQFK